MRAPFVPDGQAAKKAATGGAAVVWTAPSQFGPAWQARLLPTKQI
jgi:hypothetical protein